MALEDNSLREAMKLRQDLKDHIVNLEGLLLDARRKLKIVDDFISVATQSPTQAEDLFETHRAIQSGTESEQTATRRRRNPTPPSEMAEIAKQVILEHGRPMTRGKLVKELEARGIELVAADKAKNLGTILWRHPDIFENLPGEGYWVKGESRKR